MPVLSITPLLDLARAVQTIDRSKAEFVSTVEKQIGRLDEIRRERVRAFDIALYAAPPSRIITALSEIVIASNVPTHHALFDGLDAQIKYACEWLLRDVVSDPGKLVKRTMGIFRLKGDVNGFFCELMPSNTIDGVTIYNRGRILEVLVTFSVTHPDLSGALAVQESFVALLGTLIQHRDGRQVIVEKPGDANARLKVHFSHGA